MTRINELVQSRLTMLLRRDRHLYREEVLRLLTEVLTRNARAHDYLEEFSEAHALRKFHVDLLYALERADRRQEVASRE